MPRSGPRHTCDAADQVDTLRTFTVYDGRKDYGQESFEGVLMRAFWNDCGIEVAFFSLIDDRDRTVQFYFEADIPADVDDASHLRIILMDFPQPERNGSYGRRVTVGEVHRLTETAFGVGADQRHFGDLTFTTW